MTADERADRQDRAVNIIGWVTAAITAATLVLAALALPALLDARGTIIAQQRSDDITRCRSELRSDIDNATAVSDRAESERVDAIGDVIASSRSSPMATTRPRVSPVRSRSSMSPIVWWSVGIHSRWAV